MTSTPTDPKTAAYALLFQAQSRLTIRLSESLSAAGTVPLDVFEVLDTVSQSPDGRMRLSDLAVALGLSRSGLTRRMDRVEKAGYVSREECSDDKRGAFAVMTESGRRAHDENLPVFRETVRAHFEDRITEGEARQLGAVMKRVIGSLEKE